MTNFARSLYATSSTHIAMGVALAVIGASPAFAQDVAAEASAAAAVTAAQDPAAAADTTEQTADSDQDIVVTGIRASINASVQAKKNNTSIVEVISAEDLGKLPDLSIAESLSRLPGLATQRLDGRANVVSIRGLAPDFTTTLLNGREQVSANNNRGVELDQYPAELLNGAIVYKTPDASLIGQALGGTIDMKTIRPIAYGKRAFQVGLRGEINDLGELNPDIDNKGYRFNFSYVDQTEDGTLGWAVGFARMVSPTAEERWQAWGYPTFNWADRPTVYGWDPQGDGTFEIRPEYVEAQGKLLIGGAKPYVKSNELTRNGLMGVLEYQPDDKLHVTLDGYWSKFKDDQRLRGAELPFWWGGQNETLGTDYTVEDGLITSGTWSNVKAVVRNDIVHRTSEIFAGGLNVQYQTSDKLILEADASFSTLEKSEENIEIYAGTGRGAANGVRDTMDFALGSDGVIEFGPTLDYADEGLFLLTDPRGWCGRPGFPGDCQDGFINAPKIDDQLASLRLQATHKVGENDSLRVGMNFSRREKTLVDEGYVLTHENYPANTPIPSDLLFDPVDLDFIGIPGMVSFDSWKYFKQGHYTLTPESLWTSGRLTNSFEVTEKVLTGFVQYNIDRELGSVPLRGNVGLQIVHTDQEGDSVAASNQGGVVVIEPITDGDTFTDFLPSANLSFEVAPNNFVRVAAARVLARARMDQLNPANGFNFDQSKAANTDINASPWSGTAGNAKLKPLIADTFDLAYENYFGKGGYVALSGFYKHLESYIYQQQTLFDFTGYPFTGPVTPVLNEGFVSQWQNAGGGKIYGFEAATSLPFNTFTEALDGFGVLLSGSYTKSSVRLGDDVAKTTLPGLSKWVVNSTLYYEKYGFQARVSGRYRSEFLAEVSGLSLKRDLVSAKSEFLVDAQIGYEFQNGPMKGLSILATGYNLTNEPFVTFQNGDERQIRDHQNYGRNYMLGFSYKF